MYGLIVLFELRKHLKKIFHLTATRIKKFDQSAPLREENPPGKSIVHSIPTFRTPKDLDGMTKKSARARSMNSMIGNLKRYVDEIENMGSKYLKKISPKKRKARKKKVVGSNSSTSRTE